MPYQSENLPVELSLQRILDTKQVAEMIGFSVPHLRRLYRGGQIPKPLQLGSRKLGWRASDLLKWLDERQGGIA
jgi:predicted DNA-binding transcriptional regulator AlpA